MFFEQILPERSFEGIRNATNKVWVLGDNRFKQHFEEQTVRGRAFATRWG
jgi:hypothetical protein